MRNAWLGLLSVSALLIAGCLPDGLVQLDGETFPARWEPKTAEVVTLKADGGGKLELPATALSAESGLRIGFKIDRIGSSTILLTDGPNTARFDVEKDTLNQKPEGPFTIGPSESGQSVQISVAATPTSLSEWDEYDRSSHKNKRSGTTSYRYYRNHMGLVQRAIEMQVLKDGKAMGVVTATAPPRTERLSQTSITSTEYEAWRKQ